MVQLWLDKLQVLFVKKHVQKSWNLYTGAAKVIKEASLGRCKRLKTSKRIRIVTKRAFLFAGQGAQKLGMASDLYATCPLSKRHIDTANRITRL